ncbi:hypothetical protein B0H66DRAFT_587881 [Apodospora peruviana]|uniref:Uncharacterized protein n=1 Tax=Apodospora peruviana TaxID=516989 RepID=A0AAE0MA68_9PEZI|nr:hypothetical protein B0H66DRAFT_587881 [Apodospora peruviana]
MSSTPPSATEPTSALSDDPVPPGCSPQWLAEDAANKQSERPGSLTDVDSTDGSNSNNGESVTSSSSSRGADHETNEVETANTWRLVRETIIKKGKATTKSHTRTSSSSVLSTQCEIRLFKLRPYGITIHTEGDQQWLRDKLATRLVLDHVTEDDGEHQMEREDVAYDAVLIPEDSGFAYQFADDARVIREQYMSQPMMVDIVQRYLLLPTAIKHSAVAEKEWKPHRCLGCTPGAAGEVVVGWKCPPIVVEPSDHGDEEDTTAKTPENGSVATPTLHTEDGSVSEHLVLDDETPKKNGIATPTINTYDSVHENDYVSSNTSNNDDGIRSSESLSTPAGTSLSSISHITETNDNNNTDDEDSTDPSRRFLKRPAFQTEQYHILSKLPRPPYKLDISVDNHPSMHDDRTERPWHAPSASYWLQPVNITLAEHFRLYKGVNVQPEPAAVAAAQPQPNCTCNSRRNPSSGCSNFEFSASAASMMQSIAQLQHPTTGVLLLPYFSVEYIDSPGYGAAAATRLALAAAPALYNRWLLKRKRKTAEEWLHENGIDGESDAEDIKHYGLTVGMGMFHCWVATTRGTVTTPTEWNGCDLVRVMSGDVASYDRATALVKWINCVHAWGMGEFLRGVEDDIRTCVAGARAHDPAPFEESEDDDDDEEDEDETPARSIWEGSVDRWDWGAEDDDSVAADWGYIGPPSDDYDWDPTVDQGAGPLVRLTDAERDAQDDAIFAEVMAESGHELNEDLGPGL